MERDKQAFGYINCGFASGIEVRHHAVLVPHHPQNSWLYQNRFGNNNFNGLTHKTSTMMEITATSSPIGSEIFALISLLVISLGVLLLLRYYLPLRSTPAYLTVPIFFALGLPASIILLVPIDLASNARNEDAGSRGIRLPEEVLRVSWRISYWLTFGLTWYVDIFSISDCV